jgi:hypothetical protein
VTLRVRAGLPSLRSQAFVQEWRRSLLEASERGAFRVVHFALQDEHVHMLVEAKGKQALASGMKSIAARLGRAVNRVWSRRGPALDSRYQHRLLRTPAEVRLALADMRGSPSRERGDSGSAKLPPLHPASSTRGFVGRRPSRTADSVSDGAVAHPRTRLLRSVLGLPDRTRAPGPTR